VDFKLWLNMRIIMQDFCYRSIVVYVIKVLTEFDLIFSGYVFIAHGEESYKNGTVRFFVSLVSQQTSMEVHFTTYY